jgi:hypothetical protein
VRVHCRSPVKAAKAGQAITNGLQISAGRHICRFEPLWMRFFQEDKVPKDPQGPESLLPKLNFISAEQDLVGSEGLAAHHTSRYTTQNRAQELALRVLHFFLRFLYDVLAYIVTEIIHGGVRADHQANQGQQSYYNY